MIKNWLTGGFCCAVILLATNRVLRADNPLRSADGQVDLPAPVTDGDIVELTSGQRIVGDWLEQSVTIRGRLGDLTVPERQIKGLRFETTGTTTEFLVTRGGDTLVGSLIDPSIHFRTPDGKTITLLAADVHRLATRQSVPSTEPTTRGDTLAPLYPSITTDRGDGFAVEPPQSISFWTRFGRLDLDPNQVAAIELRLDDHPGDRVTFTDGSVLFGLMDGQTTTFVPRALTADAVTVSVAALSRIDFSKPTATPSSGLRLATGDILIGRIPGNLTIQSGQGNVQIAGSDIKTISPVEDSPGDFRVTPANAAAINGPPADGDIQFQLTCGQTIKVPVELITNYTAQ